MFFNDNSTNDGEYRKILCQIALKQHELLQDRFDFTVWQTKKKSVKRALFRRNKALDIYTVHLDELEQLKNEALTLREKKGYSHGIFWWNISWEMLEKYLLYDLTLEQGENGWRFERQWQLLNDDNEKLLVLNEEGHCSVFSSEKNYHYGRISNYSDSEISDKMREFDRMLNNYEFNTILDYPEPFVSEQTGIKYNSGLEYISSAEHYMNTDYQRTSLQNSLYTETKTMNMNIFSSSIHYHSVFAIAKMKISQFGQLTQLQFCNYKLLSTQGNMPDDIIRIYKSKDSAVRCAIYLSFSSEINEAPMEIWGCNIDEKATSFENALRQAEIITCLANKII